MQSSAAEAAVQLRDLMTRVRALRAKTRFFSKIWALAGPNIAQKGWPLQKPRGVIGKPILELLTFGSNPDFCDFGAELINFEQNWP